MDENWHYLRKSWLGEEEVGPVSLKDVLGELLRHKMRRDILVAHPIKTQGEWRRISEVNDGELYLAVESLKSTKDANEFETQHNSSSDCDKQWSTLDRVYFVCEAYVYYQQKYVLLGALVAFAIMASLAVLVEMFVPSWTHISQAILVAIFCFILALFPFAIVCHTWIRVHDWWDRQLIERKTRAAIREKERHKAEQRAREEALRREQQAKLEEKRRQDIARIIAQREANRERRNAKRREAARRRVSNLEYLRGMDPFTFEELVATVYRKLGYQAEVTPKGKDEGVDIRVLKGDATGIIQCKRYAKKVRSPFVRELFGVMKAEGVSFAVLITTCDFTEDAKAWTESKADNLVLIDGDQLLHLIEEAFGSLTEIDERFFYREPPVEGK